MLKKIGIAYFFIIQAVCAFAKAPVVVVTSFSILSDITREIGQDRIKVLEIVGPGQDVHSFQPAPRDVQKLIGANLILINGLGLEGWIPRMVEASGYQGKVVKIAEQLPQLLKLEEEHEHHHQHHHHHADYDPHVWQDPLLMKLYVNYITNALTAVDPEGKLSYEMNAKNYQTKLDQLHQWVENALAEIPIKKRQVITAHDAFAYLGKRYHIHFMAPQGTSTESEASAKDVAALVEQIRKTKVRALFIENINNPKLIKTLAREAKTKIGGELYSDALAKEPPADTYLGMYRYNIQTLVAGLKRN